MTTTEKINRSFELQDQMDKVQELIRANNDNKLIAEGEWAYHLKIEGGRLHSMMQTLIHLTKTLHGLA